MPSPAPRKSNAKPPSGFRARRDFPAGRHPLLSVFPGLDRLDIARRLEPDPTRRARLLGDTCVELVDEDVWMYVAPSNLPPTWRRRRPVVSPVSDCIVVGLGHLRDSPRMVLFMDIFHELRHVVQRQGGADLFDRRMSYARRPTEVEAYRFVVDEARKLGVSDDFLRDYLRVEWIDDKEFGELLNAVGVPPEAR